MYNIKFKALSKRGYFTLLALLIAITSFAQEITINGVVIDETDTPLIGATVQVKNTQKGVVTDFDGKFSIKANSNATLIISYIGYKNQEIKIKGQKNLNIKLEPDNAMLDEVIVVGYGSMKKSDLTGSVSSVAAKSIEGFKTGSVVEALGGQIAGVQITQSDGTPGSGFDIKIRGVGTVNGDSSPLYIVDGFEVSSIDYLPNSDIESVEVLKDASASAIYGARAANGVVLVTTKSGKEGKAVITYNGSATYRNIPKKLDMLSTYEFAALQVELNPTKYGTTYYQEGNDSDGVPYRHQTLEDYFTDPGIDWQSESFKPTWSQNHDFSISGGTKETKYAASFSHFDENGIFTNSGYKKNAGKLRINQKITKFITFDATINYANTVKEGIGTSGTGGTLNMLSNILRFRPTGGNNVTNDELLNSVFDPLELSENTTYSQINPIKQAEAVKDRRQSELWGANAALTVQLMKNLTFKASATYNTTNTRRDLFYGENSSQAYRSGGVYGSTQMQKDLRWQSSNTLTYKKKINKKNTSTQNKEEKGSKPTQQEKQPEVKQSETDEQVKGSSAVTTTATVVDKNGKKKSRKDRRKQKKNTQNPEAQSAAKTENNNTVANPGQEKPLSEPDFTESAALDIDLPDDFGIVMEPEEPLPSDLPDINSGSGNIFDDLFNSDSDNWDDSNI